MRITRRLTRRVLAIAVVLAGGLGPSLTHGTVAVAETAGAIEIAVAPAETPQFDRVIAAWSTGEVSAGRMSRLGVVSGTEAFRAVRDGKAMLALVPFATLQRFSSLYALDQIPFFTGALGEHLPHLIDAARPLISARLEEDGLVLVGLLPGAPLALWLDAAEGEPKRHLIEPMTGAERRAAELLGLSIAAAASPPRRPRAVFAPLDGAPPAATAKPIYAYRPLVLLVASKSPFEKLPESERRRLEAVVADVATLPRPQTEGAEALPPMFTAAGERMADEWAIAVGADGHEIIATYRRRRPH